MLTDKIAKLKPEERGRLYELKVELNKKYGGKVNFNFVGMVAGYLNGALSHDGRMTFFRWVFDRDEIKSSHDLTIDQQFALVMWSKSRKTMDGLGWEYAPRFLADVQILIKLFSGGTGQIVMPLEETKEERRKRIIHELTGE